MLKGGHPAQRVYFFGVLYVGINPTVCFYVCNSREVGPHSAAFSFVGMALAASLLVEKFLAVIGHGTA